MDRDDDPEARIRALEKPLSDAAQASELGQGEAPSYGYVPASGEGWHPPPPTPPPGYPSYPPTYPPTYEPQYPPTYPLAIPPPLATPPSGGRGAGFVVPIVIAVLAFAIAGVVSFFLFSRTSSDGGTTGPGVAGGGATLADTPQDRPSLDGAKTMPPGSSLPGPDVPLPPPGTDISAGGIDERQTIACNDSTLSISGIDNTYTVLGHCASLAVSGQGNVVIVESSGTISVSGIENRVTYRSGTPDVSESGFDNVVEPG